MLKNPFHKKKSLTQKVGESLHLPTRDNSAKEQLAQRLQQAFLYVSLFLAGYIIAKLQMLMK